MTAELRVTVHGLPAPQGSKRHVGRGVMVESSKKVGPWRADVAYFAAKEIHRIGWVALDEPCEVAIDFYLPRPASAPKRRIFPDRTPDLDKLIRSTLDALTTCGAIADDARVVDLTACKRYAGGLFSGTGAIITIRPFREDAAA